MRASLAPLPSHQRTPTEPTDRPTRRRAKRAANLGRTVKLTDDLHLQDTGGCGAIISMCVGVGLVILLPLAGCGGEGAMSVVPNTLRAVAARSARFVGTAVDAQLLMVDHEYAGVVAREFNSMTAENVMKWQLIHPAPERFDFAAADSIVDFARRHRMRIRGHTLVWHNQLPDYVAALSPDELRLALQQHIETVVGRYRQQVSVWDVVNEPINDFGGALRETLFSQRLGPDYIAEALRLSHSADPDAELFINDYLVDGINQKSTALYNLARDLLARGVPLHGVGLQMHLGGIFGRAPSNTQRNIERFVALGLRVEITEMDVQVRDQPGDLPQRLAAQARIYHDIVAACVAVRGCDAITFWGFTDRNSWIDAAFGPDDPLLFDEMLQPKPAYFSVLTALGG